MPAFGRADLAHDLYGCLGDVVVDRRRVVLGRARAGGVAAGFVFDVERTLADDRAGLHPGDRPGGTDVVGPTLQLRHVKLSAGHRPYRSCTTGMVTTSEPIAPSSLA